MRNLKKILALVLAMIMTLSVMATANAALTDLDSVDASYDEAVEVLTALGVFEGRVAADGSTYFAPKGTITRQEVAAILYRIDTGRVGDTAAMFVEGAKFSDVKATDWAAGYIGYCANGGLVQGYAGKFNPTDNIDGYQVLAMILRAVGYGKNGEFTGSDWQKNVAAYAQELGILSGLNKDVVLSQPATREVVAEILFKAIAYAKQVEYTPAFNYQPTLITGKTQTIGEEVFGLRKTARTEIDNWGRPGYYWFADEISTKAIACIEEDYLAQYTTKATECDISVAAFSGKDKANLICWVNGAELAQTYSIQATDVYTKLGAQGRLTEVYKDRIVMIDTLLAKVENVTTIKYDAAGHRINTSDLTLRVYDGDTDDTIVLSKTADWTYTKGQYVLVNVETDVKGELFGAAHNDAIAKDAVVLGVADSFVGAQTIIHYNDGKHTIDGVDYLDASCFHENAAGISSAKFTWFKDQYGNIIGSAVIPSTYEYGVIKNIQWFTQAGVYGYAQATMVMMDGTEKSIVVSAIADHDDTKVVGTQTVVDATPLTYALSNAASLDAGLVSTEIMNNYADFAGTDLYRISDNGNGTYTLVDVANTVVGGKQEATTVVTGAHVMGSTLVDSETQYLVRTYGTNAVDTNEDGVKDANVNSTYTAVTGFNNIGKYNNAVVDYIDTDKDGRAELVYIVGESAAAKTAGLFYRSTTTNSYYVPVTGTTSDYYVLTGYLNGVAGEIKTKDVAVRNTIITAPADTLFDITIENGYVKTAVAVPAANTALNAVTGYTGPYTKLTGSSYKDSGNDKVADFSLYYDADALTIANIGWNVTEATRVVGELVAGKTYDSLNYTIHVVWDNETMDAVEVYVFEKTAGGSAGMDSVPGDTVVYQVKIYNAAGQLVNTIEAATWKNANDAKGVKYTDLLNKMQDVAAGKTDANWTNVAGALEALTSLGLTDADVTAIDVDASTGVATFIYNNGK